MGNRVVVRAMSAPHKDSADGGGMADADDAHRDHSHQHSQTFTPAGAGR